MQPINYMLEVADPFQKALQGYQTGMALRQNQQAMAQAEAQRQAAAQMQADLQAVANNPRATGADYAALSTKYPQLSEHFKRSFDMLSAEQQRSKLEHMGQVYAAIESGQPQFAVSTLRSRAEALRASGDEAGAKSTEDFAKLVELNPQTARNSAALMLSSAMGPEKFAETFSKLGVESRAAAEAPHDLRKKAAEATTAEAKAKYAERDVLLDLEQKGWNIKKVQADIAADRERNRIAAMNAAISRETNDLKRQELQLKVKEAETALGDKLRARVADYEAGQATLQDALNLLTEIRANPDALASATGASAWIGKIPGTPERTIAGKVEQLQNTLAAANLDKLKGAMSDKDLLFLKNIATNLDRFQNQDQFVKELGKVEQTLIRAEKQLRSKFGAPAAGRPVPSVEPAQTSTAQRNVVVDW